MENLFSSGAPHIPFFLSSAMILLVSWFVNDYGIVLLATSKASSKVN